MDSDATLEKAARIYCELMGRDADARAEGDFPGGQRPRNWQLALRAVSEHMVASMAISRAMRPEPADNHSNNALLP